MTEIGTRSVLRPRPEDAYREWAARFDAAAEANDRARTDPQPDDCWGASADRWGPSAGIPVPSQLLELANPSQVWLDAGAGGGRVAAAVAPHVREFRVCDPSPGMTERLRRTAREATDGTITVLPPTAWPPSYAIDPVDVVMSSHVIYFVREIGAFIDALEAHATERCVVIAMALPGAAPQSEELWELVHGDPYVPAAASREFIAVLNARDTPHEVRFTDPPGGPGPPGPATLDEMVERHRGRYLVAAGSDGESRLRQAMQDRFATDDGLIALPPRDPRRVIITWEPKPAVR